MSLRAIKRLERMRRCDPARLTERERTVSNLHGGLKLLGEMIPDLSSRVPLEAAWVAEERTRFDEEVSRLLAMVPASQEARASELKEELATSLSAVTECRQRIHPFQEERERQEARYKQALTSLALLALRGRRNERGGDAQ